MFIFHWSRCYYNLLADPHLLQQMSTCTNSFPINKLLPVWFTVKLLIKDQKITNLNDDNNDDDNFKTDKKETIF